MQQVKGHYLRSVPFPAAGPGSRFVPGAKRGNWTGKTIGQQFSCISGTHGVVKGQVMHTALSWGSSGSPGKQEDWPFLPWISHWLMSGLVTWAGTDWADAISFPVLTAQVDV